MKINILEFKVKDHLFGIRTEFVKSIFEIESFRKSPLLPKNVIGFTSYNKHIYPLICMEKLLSLSEECTDPHGKTAIVINAGEKYFALVVDEILKIQEIEKNQEGNEVINFYNLQGKLLEEITPEFISLNVKIPHLNQKISSQSFSFEEKDKNFSERSFLIFTLGNQKCGLDTDFIRKVEYAEGEINKITKDQNSWIDGVFLLKNNVIKVGNLKKLLGLKDNQTNEKNLVIIEDNNKIFSFLVDEIVDIHSISEEKINRSTKDSFIFKDFIVHEKTIVPIISEEFIKESFEKYSIKINSSLEEFKQKKNEVDILLFKIGKERFGVQMENVSEVFDYSDTHVSSYPTENKSILGVVTARKETYFLITYEHILGEKVDKNSEDTKILVISDDKVKIAILISEIEDIVHISEDNIAKFEDNSQFIKGTFLTKEGELVNLLNPSWIVSEFKKENELREAKEK